MKFTFIILITLLLYSCNSIPDKNENWEDGSPKIRILIKNNGLKESDPKYFYRKYVRYYKKGESDTTLNYYEESFEKDGTPVNSKNYVNGKREF